MGVIDMFYKVHTHNVCSFDEERSTEFLLANANPLKADASAYEFLYSSANIF